MWRPLAQELLWRKVWISPGETRDNASLFAASRGTGRRTTELVIWGEVSEVEAVIKACEGLRTLLLCFGGYSLRTTAPAEPERQVLSIVRPSRLTANLGWVVRVAGIVSLSLRNVKFTHLEQSVQPPSFHLRHLGLDYLSPPDAPLIPLILHETLQSLALTLYFDNLNDSQLSTLIGVASQLTTLILPSQTYLVNLKPFFAACTNLSHFTSSVSGSLDNLPFLRSSIETLTVTDFLVKIDADQLHTLLTLDILALSKLRKLEIAPTQRRGTADEEEFNSYETGKEVVEECERRGIQLVWV